MTNFKKIVIFFFSGTGNAENVSRWLAENAAAHNKKTEVINIGLHPVKIPERDENTLLGFVFPTHGFNLAPAMLHFIYRFPKGRNNFFLLNTRAGTKLRKIYFPGLSGTALYLPALVLKIKGYRFSGFRPIDLPSNWISIHPALRGSAVEKMHMRCKGITDNFLHKILDGKKVFRGLYDFPLDVWLFPISVLYYIFGRFFLAKTFIATYKCKECGLCVKNCPTGSLVYKDEKPYWLFTCESCMKCMNHCPEKAIETPHGLTFMLWALCFSFIPPHLYRFVLDIFSLNIYFSKLIYWLLYCLSAIILVGSSYRIIHYLMRFRWINYIISYTSITKLKFWGRYRALKKI